MLPIIMFAVGFISGMYIVTQIEKGIDKNIDNDEPIVEHDGMRYNPETLEFKEMDRQDDRDSDPPLTKEEKELIKKIK
jgi:hypothetical protein